MTADGSVWASYAWALDFVRALKERPLIAKAVLRILFGKYAYREFVGLAESLSQYWDGALSCGYGLEEMNYHNDDVRKDWWNIP